MRFATRFRHNLRDVSREAQRIHRDTQRFLNDVDRTVTTVLDAVDQCYHYDRRSKTDTTKQRGAASERPTHGVTGTYPWQDRQTPTPSQGAAYHVPSPSASTLTDIIDGATHHRWQDRQAEFHATLPASYDKTSAAYIHGYLDAQDYLATNHPGILDDLHGALRRATQR